MDKVPGVFSRITALPDDGVLQAGRAPHAGSTNTQPTVASIGGDGAQLRLKDKNPTLRKTWGPQAFRRRTVRLPSWLVLFRSGDAGRRAQRSACCSTNR